MKAKLNILEPCQTKDDMMSMATLEHKERRKPSVIAESPVISKKMTSKDKLTICLNDFLNARLSKTLDLELTLKEKAYYPFFSEQAKELSSNLYLPTKTDYADSDLISLDGLLKTAVDKSWFSTKLIFHPNKNLPKTSLQFCMSSHVECTDLEVIKTKLLRISPTKKQKQLFKSWTDCSRYVFNQTFDYIRSCIGWTPTWMDIKKDMLKQLPDWCKPIPFQIKGIAIKEACNAFWKAKGNPSFRTRKNPEQSCFIPKTALSSKGVYPTISGKGLYFQESLPDNPKDSRLIWRYEKWWMAVPYLEKLIIGESQTRIVSLDPGIRSFITFYSLEHCGHLGKGDFSRIQRLCSHLDNLISKRDLTKNKQKRRSLTKASRKMRAKIKNLITEIHHKTAKFLTDNFDVILLPTFETKQMSNKAGRKIRKKSVRSMLTFSHYKFKQFLKWKAFQTGKLVVDCCEAYTSKTHPQTGEIKNIGSAEWIKLLDGSRANRDIVGARGILLRALVDSPMRKRAVNES